MEKAGILQEEAGDHIRIIVAEGIAEMAGDRYRSYPLVPRPDKVPIRRDLYPHPCVLATPASTESVKKEKKKNGSEAIGAPTNASSSAKTATTMSTSRGASRRVSAWAAGVVNASSGSDSPENSIVFETRLAANASRWDAILNQPINLSGSAPYSSYTLFGRKIEKRAVSPNPTEDTSTDPPPTTGTAISDGIAGIIKVDGKEIDEIFDTPAHAAASPKSTVAPAPQTTADPKTTGSNDIGDWLIDLST
ncbi:hypothetical protein N0V82_005459 [Gnomoniopsis sp. IMI 355080]|nr:hypothetical protein N0V82_005459 [Gnomoniopsis sp. IMI 355080]